MARGIHLDEMLAVTFANRDFQAPPRPKTVNALHDPVERGTGRIRGDRDLVGPDEEACLTIRKSLRIKIELASGEVDIAGFDGDRNRHRLADEVVHERARRPF